MHVAMETTKTSNFTCHSKSFISIFFTCQVSACELQPFSCHDLANDIHSKTAKTVFSHLKLSCIQLNLSTTATFGKEESGRRREGAFVERCKEESMFGLPAKKKYWPL